MVKLLSKWQESIDRKIVEAVARASTMDKKTMALLSMVGVVGIMGFSFAGSDMVGFVTCDGAHKIHMYARPIAIFLAVVVFIVGIMMAAFEAFSKKYGHALAVLLFAVVITGFLWGASGALDTYGQQLESSLCGQTQ
jgi:hypothetical protein